MSARDLILDFAAYSLDRVLAGLDDIRQFNPQRFEFEQLSAIVYEDPAEKICVGYQDLPPDSFWARGHMPGCPVMPGVLLCEAAAQLCSYFSGKYDLLGAKVLGFGGIDGVRFRDPVLPGQRLVIVSQVMKVRRGAMVVSRFQEFVEQNLVCEGEIKGVPLPMDRLMSG